MRLDIEIDGGGDLKPSHLFIDDFDFIVDKIKSLKNCPLYPLSSCLYSVPLW